MRFPAYILISGLFFLLGISFYEVANIKTDSEFKDASLSEWHFKKQEKMPLDSKVSHFKPLPRKKKLPSSITVKKNTSRPNPKSVNLVKPPSNTEQKIREKEKGFSFQSFSDILKMPNRDQIFFHILRKEKKWRYQVLYEIRKQKMVHFEPELRAIFEERKQKLGHRDFYFDVTLLRTIKALGGVLTKEEEELTLGGGIRRWKRRFRRAP